VALLLLGTGGDTPVSFFMMLEFESESGCLDGYADRGLVTAFLFCSAGTLFDSKYVTRAGPQMAIIRAIAEALGFTGKPVTEAVVVDTE
jgi:hypothetical protein